MNGILILQREHQDLRQTGEGCSDCCEHFTPRRVTQIWCPNCIQVRTGGGLL